MPAPARYRIDNFTSVDAAAVLRAARERSGVSQRELARRAKTSPAAVSLYEPRFALHGPTVHPVDGKEKDCPGEAKIAGRAIPVEPGAETFAADITEVVITRLSAEATKLVVES